MIFNLYVDEVSTVDHWRCVDVTSFSPCKSPAIPLVEGDRTSVSVEYVKMHQILISFSRPPTYRGNHELSGSASLMGWEHMKAVEQCSVGRVIHILGTNEANRRSVTLGQHDEASRFRWPRHIVFPMRGMLGRHFFK